MTGGGRRSSQSPCGFVLCLFDPDTEIHPILSLVLSLSVWETREREREEEGRGIGWKINPGQWVLPQHLSCSLLPSLTSSYQNCQLRDKLACCVWSVSLLLFSCLVSRLWIQEKEIHWHHVYSYSVAFIVLTASRDKTYVQFNGTGLSSLVSLTVQYFVKKFPLNFPVFQKTILSWIQFQAGLIFNFPLGSIHAIS